MSISAGGKENGFFVFEIQMERWCVCVGALVEYHVTVLLVVHRQ